METTLLKEMLFLTLENRLHKTTNAVGFREDSAVSVPNQSRLGLTVTNTRNKCPAKV